MIVTGYKPNTKLVYEAARRSFENLMQKKAEDATIQDIETWLHNLRSIDRPASTCRTFLSAINHISGLKITPRGLPRTSTTQAILSYEQIKKILQSMKKEDTALFLLLLLFGIEAGNWTWGKIMNEQLNVPEQLWKAIADHAVEKGYSTFPLTYYGANYHWINGAPLLDAAFTSGKRKELSAAPLTIQEVNRRLKKYGLWAGILPNDISLRIWVRTGKILLAEHKADAEEALEALGFYLNSTWFTTAGPGMKNGHPIVQWRPEAFGTQKGASAHRVDRDPRLHGIGRRKRVTVGN